LPSLFIECFFPKEKKQKRKENESKTVYKNGKQPHHLREEERRAGIWRVGEPSLKIININKIL
jgi:hypothetical protein